MRSKAPITDLHLYKFFATCVDKKTSTILIFVGFCFVLLISTGCRKCKDPNSENEGLKETCAYRTLTGVEIISFPLTKTTGENWDDTLTGGGFPCDSCKYPDLRIQVNCASDSWGFRNTNTLLDADGTGYYFINVPLTFRNEIWTFELYDRDEEWVGLYSHELMGQGTFNPLVEGANGIIPVSATNGIEVNLHYHLTQ